MPAGSDSPSPSKASRRCNGGLSSAPTLTLIIVTEVIKWLVILTAIYLGVWQYCDMTDPDDVISGGNETSTPSGQAMDSYAKCSLGEAKTIGQFWGAFSGIIAGISIALYLPWRIFAIKLRFKHYIFRDERW